MVGLLVLMLVVNVATLILLFWVWRQSPYDRMVRLDGYLAALERGQAQGEQVIREEFARSRAESGLNARQGRDEQSGALNAFGESVSRRMTEIATLQKQQLDSFASQLAALTGTTEQKLEQVRGIVEAKLTQLQAENSAKLEQMRATVDEKLQATLEQRLGESFKLVSERLEQVHKGLGEMQSLATRRGRPEKGAHQRQDPGHLGRDPARHPAGAAPDAATSMPGTWPPSRAATTGSSSPSGCRGADRSRRRPVWLPIDAKFPAGGLPAPAGRAEQGRPGPVPRRQPAQLEARIKPGGQEHPEKYLDPPHTTDFAIMFLPTEGLYAEVLRRPGLVRIAAAGVPRDGRRPHHLVGHPQQPADGLPHPGHREALQRGLAAAGRRQDRIRQVRRPAGQDPQEAGGGRSTIEDASKKSRTIERRLKDVQALPAPDTAALMDEAPEPDSD